MEELRQIYYESGIWLKYNWYDFLSELVVYIWLSHSPLWFINLKQYQ